MYVVQKPSKNLFVVHTKHDREKIQDKLEKLGEVEKLKGSDNILLLHLSQKTPDAKAAWELIRQKLGEEEIVHPVLLDDSGSPQYPTGEICVRFQSSPSDAQLKRFAASHGLRLHSRNEFMPQQAIFESLKPGEQYVTELVQEIAGEKNIQLAWVNTLSRFDRA
ncbi:MAG: hypothetical protein M3458_13905 [Acidobacteriota bacterium]|nr:hypothetical protein [Acidobacteriota bacterium]